WSAKAWEEENERYKKNGAQSPVLFACGRPSSRRGCWIGLHGGCATTRSVATRGGRAWRPVLGRTGLAARHDVVKLLRVNGFPFQHGLGHGVHLVLVLL